MIDTRYHGDDDVIVENIGDVYHPKVGRMSGDSTYRSTMSDIFFLAAFFN